MSEQRIQPKRRRDMTFYHSSLNPFFSKELNAEICMAGQMDQSRG